MGVSPLRKFVQLPKWSGEKTGPPPFQWWKAPPCSYNSRVGTLVDTIVIHATAGSSAAGAMSVSNACKASWHWLVPDENEAAHGSHLWRCVSEHAKAWHVLRKVKFPIDGRTDINARSIGVEIVNNQSGDSDPFSDWQLSITAAMVNYHRSENPDVPFYLATHAYLDPNRKNDPGSIFNWERFMELINNGGDGGYVDVDDYAQEAVAWCKETGIMTGLTDELFGGRDPIKRQDLAIVAKRLNDLLYRIPHSILNA